MPSEGGVRTMLIAALPRRRAAGGRTGAGGGAPRTGEAPRRPEAAAFALGATAGDAVPEPRCRRRRWRSSCSTKPARPIPNHASCSAWSTRTRRSTSSAASSDAAGLARFTGPAQRRRVGYAAVIEWNGHAPRHRALRDARRGRARAPRSGRWRARPTPASITIGPARASSLQMRRTRWQFLEMLPLENKSDKIFDPGAGALEIPLPTGSRERPGRGGAIASSRSARTTASRCAARSSRSARSSPPATRVRSGGGRSSSSLPYRGDTHDFEQTLPNGIGPSTLIIEQKMAEPHRQRPRRRRARGAVAGRQEVLGDAGRGRRAGRSAQVHA